MDRAEIRSGEERSARTSESENDAITRSVLLSTTFIASFPKPVCAIQSELYL
jgi:hypothetical protein